jgi:chromosome partitioning protein
MKIITFGTRKGGAGKTALTFNVAGVLAENHKVLLMDFDPQVNLTGNVGLDTTVQDAPCILDIFKNYTSAAPERVITHSPIEQLPNLDIIAGHLDMEDVEMQLVSKPAREFVIQRWVKANREFLDQYDYILCDTNPSTGLINQNAFVAADSIVLVSDISEESRMGAMQFVYKWDKIRDAYGIENNVRAMVLNNVDKRISQADQLEEYYRDDEDFGPLLLKATIPYRADMKRTSPNCMPINILAPKSDAYEAVRAVVAELKEKGVF